jgi:hypothetical protein
MYAKIRIQLGKYKAKKCLNRKEKNVAQGNVINEDNA